MQGIQIGNAPCSWGTLEFGSLKADRISPTQMLDELVKSGYTGCELGDWGFFPTNPDELYALFAERQLAMTGAYVGVPFRDPTKYAAGEAEVIKIAQQMATLADRLGSAWSPVVVLADDNATDPVRTKHAGRVDGSMLLSEAEGHTFAQGVNNVAAAVRAQTGLRTAIHNHCAGFIERPDEIEQILALTDPDLVGLVMDSGHYVFGAGRCDDLLAAFDRLADRIWYVHFKDCDAQLMDAAREQEWDYFESVEHGIFCELGQGCVDFPDARAWLRDHNYQGFITVEQDILPGMGNPYDSAVRNRRYLTDIGL